MRKRPTPGFIGACLLAALSIQVPDAAFAAEPAGPDFLDQNQYVYNVRVHGHFPHVARYGGHTWTHVFDHDGRRYMFHYYRQNVNLYDITDAKSLELVLEKRYEGQGWGAATIAHNDELGKTLMIQAVEVPRSAGGMDEKKYEEPWRIDALKAWQGFRGVDVYEVTSPTEWERVARLSADGGDPDRAVQQGSGGLDTPTYTGGKYAFVATAPDDTFINQESLNYYHAPGQMILDVSNPADPSIVSTWWVPGMRVGEEDEYRKWPAYGNKVSWTGARTPIQVPTPLEEGGRYGYAPMGALGLYVLDLSDPAAPKAVGHVAPPVKLVHYQGDNVDVTRVNERGIALFNGFVEPGCDGPYADVHLVDVSDPESPRIIAALPRPTPPPGAPFADYCERGGSFGPKRPTPPNSPGAPDPNLTAYSFGPAGVQIFDISDARHPAIAGYFVPPMSGDADDIDVPWLYDRTVGAIQIEWDRKLIWAIANTGVYLLSSPLLGEPDFGPPDTGVASAH